MERSIVLRLQDHEAATGRPALGFMHRLASAPISWGVCEVPGWGAEMPPHRVLTEMANTGVAATELGSPGYFPSDPTALRDVVASYGLEMIGGFVALVLHDPAEEAASIAAARKAAELMSGAGGIFFITAALTNWEWAPRVVPDHLGWRQVARMFDLIDEIAGEFGMVQALHPHLGTIVETGDDIARVLDISDVGWTLDTGHMLIGGTDPVAFARDHFDRVRHVHLKDAHLRLANPVFRGEQTIMEGVQAGMFCNLGQGDVPIREVVTTLERNGYDQWYVLEQDAALTDGLPADGRGPALDVQASVDFLRSVDTELSAPQRAVDTFVGPDKQRT